MKQLFIFLSLFCAALAHAQTITIVADSLRLPLGLEIAANGDILVTESGYGFNDGAVSILRPDGSLQPVIVGLPSIFDTTSQEAVGPWRSAMMANNQLGVLSPLDGGILVYDLNGFVPGITPPISGASPTSQIIISDFVNSNQPPTMPDSNPYSVAFDEDGNLYIVDSGFNGIIKVDATTGVRSVFAVFPKWPNPLPFGPPEVDPVPTRIINKPGGGFLVCTLTGFPFQEGSAGVYTVDMNGSISNY
ncbi:MAG: ScyD/ScyE family protein, partial [Saprospiraceae bacterium]|nr:ScyD/ScyE family protein [Saprospiraceae bacterium]